MKWAIRSLSLNHASSLPDSKVDDLIGGDGMSQEDPNRFYVMYGKACLLINKAVLTFSIQDIDAAKNSVNEAKNSAYKYVYFSRMHLYANYSRVNRY